MNKVIIVGGVAGGATAAARIRRLDETAQIIVFEKSGNVSYANCGIPYYIGGVIEGEGNLIVPLRFPVEFPAVDRELQREIAGREGKTA